MLGYQCWSDVYIGSWTDVRHGHCYMSQYDVNSMLGCDVCSTSKYDISSTLGYDVHSMSGY